MADGCHSAALNSNGPLGQPTMGGTAELSCRPIEVGQQEKLPRGAHDATAGGTIVERRPNGPFEASAPQAHPKHTPSAPQAHPNAPFKP